MGVSWIKTYDPKVIAGKLESIKSFDDQGAVSFNAFDFEDLTVLLGSMVEFGETIPQPQKAEIIYKASFNTGKKGKITQEKLLAEINRIAKDYSNRTVKRFQIITSLSINPFCQLSRLTIDNCQISFNPSLPIAYKGTAGRNC